MSQQLNREVFVWSNPLGTIAIPTTQNADELQRRDEDLPPVNDPAEFQSVRFFGVFAEGTPVEDIVDIGAHDRVRCTIDGQRVTTVRWAISG